MLHSITRPAVSLVPEKVRRPAFPSDRACDSCCPDVASRVGPGGAVESVAVLVAARVRERKWRIPRLGAATLAGLAVVAWPSGAVAATRLSASTSAILKAGLMVQRDVPSNWASTAARTNPELLRVEGIGPCASTRAALSAANRGARRTFSREFVAPDRIGAAQDVVFVGRSNPATLSFAAAYAGPQGRACVQGVADKVAKQASGTAVVTPLTDVAAVGDQAVGYEFQITAPNHGALITGVSDLVVVRVGPAVIGFQFQNAVRALPERMSIVNAVVTRLRAVTTG